MFGCASAMQALIARWSIRLKQTKKNSTNFRILRAISNEKYNKQAKQTGDLKIMDMHGSWSL